MYCNVAIAVISYSQISPASFSRVVTGVKRLLKIAVDGTERICLEIQCMLDQSVQHIRIAGVKCRILVYFIDVTCSAVFGTNR